MSDSPIPSAFTDMMMAKDYKAALCEMTEFLIGNILNTESAASQTPSALASRVVRVATLTIEELKSQMEKM